MELNTIFTQLQHGELTQTVVSDASGEISPEHYPKLIAHINLGITALYKRFLLWEKSIHVELQDHITTYQLHKDFARTSLSTQPIKYLIDTDTDKFGDSKILQVLNIYSELGEEFILNPAGDISNVMKDERLLAATPSQTTLQIPYPTSGSTILVEYRAAPLDIPGDTIDLSYEVNLPDILLEALLAYIGDRYFSTNTPQNKEAIIYPNKFEKACSLVDTFSLVEHNQITQVNYFEENGWL